MIPGQLPRGVRQPVTAQEFLARGLDQLRVLDQFAAMAGVLRKEMSDETDLRGDRIEPADQHQQRHRHDLVRSRSEEHTSELQSLMRISYAVFCLKKKTTPTG